MSKRKPNEYDLIYQSMTQRELWDAMQEAKTGSQFRAIHRALRKYGDGVTPNYRYPLLPQMISLIAFVISIIALVVKSCVF